MVDANLWAQAAISRGGVKQRASFIFASHSGGDRRSQSDLVGTSEFHDEPCALTDALLQLVAWGLLFPATAGWVAREAVLSGCNTSKIKKFGQIGASGDSTQNSRRDLFNTFFKHISVPKPLAVPCKILDGWKRIIDGNVYVCNPFELLQSIWKHHRGIFLDVVGHNPAAFWNAVRADDPKLEALPSTP